MARRRHSSRRRRGSSGFLYKLLSVLVICGAIIAALTLFFRVETIAVSGQRRYTEAEIIEAGGKAKVTVTMLTSAFVMMSSLFVLIGPIFIIMQNTGF